MSGELIAAAGVGAAASIGGGVLSSLLNRRAQERDRDFQREVLQNAVQWRTEDAKKAGLHPLYALGANVATSSGSPQFIGDPVGPSLAEAGQNISNAIMRSQQSDERMKNQMDLALAVKSMQESDARIDYTRAQIRQLEQANQQSPAGMGLRMEQLPIEGQAPNPPGIGVIEMKPVEQISGKQGSPHVAAGTQPWFQENSLAGGRLPFQTPRGQGEHPEELLSEMSLGAYLGLLKQNEATYGEGWLKDFMLYRYLGIPPDRDYSGLFGSPMPGGAMYVPGSGTKDAIKRALKRGMNIPKYPRYRRKFNK